MSQSKENNKELSELPIFDIRTTSTHLPDGNILEMLEERIDEKPKGIFTYHRRTPSDELSLDVLQDTFEQWKLVDRQDRKRTRKGRGGILLYTPPPNTEINPDLPVEPVQTHVMSSKRNNVKEVKVRTNKHKDPRKISRRKKGGFVPHGDEDPPGDVPSSSSTQRYVEDEREDPPDDSIRIKQEEMILNHDSDVETLLEEFPSSSLTELPESVIDAIQAIPKHIQPGSNTDKWVHHLENMCIYTYQLCRAESLMDCFVATLAYIKMNFTRSVSSFAAELAASVMELVDQTDKQTFETKTMLARWETLKTNTVFGKIKYLISAAMTLPILDLKEISWNPMGFKLMQVKALEQTVHATDVIDAVLKTFTWISDTGCEIIRTGSLAPILYDDVKMKEFNERCDWVLAHGDTALAGNLEDIHDWESKLEKAIVDVCELKRIKNDGATGPWLQRRYEQLVEYQDGIIAKHRNTTMREAPIGFGLYGPTGVGKSTLAQLIMKTSLCSVLPSGEFDQTKVLNKDMFDKYDSTWTSDIQGVFLDDVGNGKAEFQERAHTDVIIKFFNNIAATAVKAELNAKGRVFINFKVGVLTTNIKDFGASQYSECPESILRRFHHIHVRVKPKFCINGGVSLNTYHPELQGASLTKDVWELDMLECEPYVTPDTKSTGYSLRFADIPDGKGGTKKAQNLTLKEMLTAVVWMSKNHKKAQQNVLARTKEFIELPMCPKCGLPHSLCDCLCLDCSQAATACKCQKFRPQSSEFKELVGSFMKDSVVAYIKSWVFPDQFFWKVLGWRPIQTMLTKELAHEVRRGLDYYATPWIFSFVPERIMNLPAMNHYINLWAKRAAYYDVRWHLKWLNGIMLGCICPMSYLAYKEKRMSSMILPVSCMTLANVGMYGMYRTRVSLEKEAFLQRRDGLMSCIVPKMEMTEVATLGIAVLGLGLRAFHGWYFQQKGNLPHAGEPKDDHPGWMGYYIQKLGFNVHAQPSTKTASAKQLTESLTKRNLFWAWFIRKNGSKTKCNIFFPEKGVALFPQHVWYPYADMDEEKTECLTVEVHRHGSPGGRFTFVVDEASCVTPPDMDVTFAYVPNCPDFRTMIKWFPALPPTGRALAQLVVCQREDFENAPNQFSIDNTEVKFGVEKHSGMEFYGGRYKSSLARDGACMGCVITNTKDPVLVGFHIGGNPLKDEGVMQTVTLPDYERNRRRLNGMSNVVLSAQSDELPVSQYDKKLLANDRVHPHCMASRMGVNDCVEIYGSTQLRTKQRSTVQPSILSKEVERVCGVPNKWGPPKLEPNWEGYNATLEHIARPPLMFRHTLLNRACQDWIKPLLEEMKRLDVYFQPLTFKESILGIPGKRFIDPIPMSTSMGFPLFGQKKKYFTDVKKGEVLVDRIPDKAVVKEYDRMLACWQEGKRAYPVSSATLKDEPTPVGSSKVRVFQAAPVAFSMHVRRLFLPVMRFLCANPTLSECAVGMNAFGPEWDTLIDHAFSYDSDEGVLAWDYSKYDVRMSSQVVKAVLGMYIELALGAGYHRDDIHIMRMMVNDIAHPLIDYNGVLLMAFNMNTSGNSITVNINSTANSLYVRMGFFSCIPEVEDFRANMACMTYGDDFIGSLRKQYHDRFNFEVYRDFLAKHDMKITLPDKGNTSSAFMEIEDVDFLKRKSKYIEEIGTTIGQLDEMSIFKSLHANLKSKEATPEQVAASCVESAMHEWFAFGKDHYELRREQMKEVCHNVGLQNLSILDHTFEDRVDHWREKHLLG